MSREWKPGDDLPSGGIRFWFNARALEITLGILKREYREAYDELLGDIREQVASPVAMISPEDREAVERLLSAYLDNAGGVRPYDHPPHFIDSMQAALREFANPKPPKPDEPQGLGARATDRGGLEWAARTGLHPAPDGMGLTERRWGCLNGTASDLTWDELIAARGPLTVEVDQ